MHSSADGSKRDDVRESPQEKNAFPRQKCLEAIEVIAGRETLRSDCGPDRRCDGQLDSEWWAICCDLGRLFKSKRELQNVEIALMAAHNLNAHWEAGLGETGWDRNGW